MTKTGQLRDLSLACKTGTKSAVFGAMLLVSACGLFGQEEKAPPCPQVSVLADASVLTKFQNGPGRDLVDVDYQGKIADIQPSCVYELNDADEGTVEVSVEVRVVAERGIANKTRRADFTYFVTVTDPNRNILSKESFNVSAEFPGNRTRVGVIDTPVALKIPIRKGKGASSYDVFVGFQLSREQLEFNRRRMTNL